MNYEYFFTSLYLFLFCILNPASGQRTIDLNQVNGDLRVTGKTNYNKTGFGLACGDVNGDSIADVIIGAPGMNPDGTSTAGRVFVIYGDSFSPKSIDLNTDSVDLEITSIDEHAGLGYSVHSVDFNGDAIEDIVVSAPFADKDETRDVGAVFVVWGSKYLPNRIDLRADAADVVIWGEKAYDEFGKCLASGDINGDKFQDLIIGADRVDSPGLVSTGAGYILYGNESLPNRIEIGDYNQSTTIYGRDANDLLGRSCASGDLNGDGFDDLVLAAYKADTPLSNPIVDAGEVYIFFGRVDLPRSLDLSNSDADITILGSERQGWLGFALAIGDLNEDSIDDLVIGAPQQNSGSNINSGQVHILFGKSEWPGSTIDLSSEPADVEIIGPAASAKLGSSCTILDLDHQGADDLALGAPFYTNTEGVNAGAVFGLVEVAKQPTIDLIMQPAYLLILGDDAGDLLGNSVTSGDINGDGVDDVVFCAVDAEPNGEVYAIFGQQNVGIRVDGDRHVLTRQLRLYVNYPNPFNSQTTIRYNMPVDAHVAITIYDLRGEYICTLVEERKRTGNHTANWNGMNYQGVQVPSGVYTCRFWAKNTGNKAESFYVNAIKLVHVK